MSQVRREDDVADYDGFSRLFQDLGRRWQEPWKHPTFVFHCITSLVLVGGMGIWLEILNLITGTSQSDPLGSLRSAFLTYFPAVVGSAYLQLTIANERRAFKSFANFFTVAITMAAIILVFARGLSDWFAIFLGVLFSLASIWFWWVVNADDDAFRDDDDATVATGGANPTAPLRGDLENFEV